MDGFGDFWILVSGVWEKGVGGIDVGKMLTAAGIFIGFLLLRRLFSKFVMSWLKSVTSRSKTSIDDVMIETLEPPLRLVPLVLGVFFSARYLQPTGLVSDVADNLVKTLIAISIFWGLLRILQPLSSVLSNLEKVFTVELVDWLVKSIRIAVILIGGATVLQIWGIEVAPIIAGAGLFGVAVALGAQDLFKNLIAGLLIIGEKRFRKGDWILVVGVVEGTVESIGFRSTVVRRFDKAPVMVPNTNLSDTAVINFSGMTSRRIYWTIGVTYNTSVDQLRVIRDGIENYVLSDGAFVAPEDAATFVRIDRFSDNSIDIMLYCFTKTTDWGEWLKIKEQLAYHIKQTVENAGSGFAFPSRSVYVEHLPASGPEIFVPPSIKKNTGKTI